MQHSLPDIRCNGVAVLDAVLDAVLGTAFDVVFLGVIFKNCLVLIGSLHCGQFLLSNCLYDLVQLEHILNEHFLFPHMSKLSVSIVLKHILHSIGV